MAKRITKGNLWGYIQSRPYASVSDIRRLFMMDIDGAATIPSNEGTCYIGLPQDAADIVGLLWQEGRIALDLNPNLKARVVQGIYPARVSLQRHQGTSQATRSSGGRAQTDTSSEPEGQSSRKRRRRRKKSGAGQNAEVVAGGEDSD